MIKTIDMLNKLTQRTSLTYFCLPNLVEKKKDPTSVFKETQTHHFCSGLSFVFQENLWRLRIWRLGNDIHILRELNL